MKSAERPAKPASVPTTGLSATLRGLLHAEGTGAPSSATQPGHVSTIARSLTLAVLVSVSALACVLAAGVGSAVAATTQFGERGALSGQLEVPYGVAVNQASGDVYVGDRSNHRVDKFTGSGGFLLAWGWGVDEESPAEELQTCTTLCQKGREGSGAGQFAGEGPHGVAVDNEPSSPSHGDLYVVDWENFRVEKFSPEGGFVLMFGGGVLTGGATGTGTVTSSSNHITSVVTTSKAFVMGQTVTGAGIPAGTRISGLPNEAGTIELSKPATASGAGVPLTVSAGSGSVAVNERQTVTIGGAPTGGTFTLTFRTPNPSPTEATSSPIAFNALASGAGSVQEALEGLSNIGPGNVAVSGSAGGPYTVEFKGTRFADTNVEQIGAESSLTGGTSPGVAVTTSVEGHSAPADDVCSNAPDCAAGVEGTANGQFSWAYEGSYIAVGPGSKVYVGDKGRVQVFEPSGTWKEKISPPSLNELEGEAFELQATALAVDSSGDMFVTAGGVEGVREIAPNGVEMLTRFDQGSFSVTALAVDEKSGDLYVGDSNGGFHILRYDPAGKELASFGSNTVEASKGMAFANTPGELYVTGSTIQTEQTPSETRVFIFTPPEPGPLVEPGSESGTPGLHGAATLEAVVNPEGFETTYHVEYLTEKQFKEDGDTFGTGTVATTESASIGSEFEDQHVELKLPEGTLIPGVTYHWRVVASNACELGKTCTSPGPDGTFEETPAALVDGPWTADLTSTSVTLFARINPLEASTSYRLEYGTSASYGHAFSGVVVFSGEVGEHSEFVTVGGYRVQELEPGTTYHYRIVTTNECVAGKPLCTQEGADRTFTTQSAGGSGFALPDGRAWELVSPASMGGALLQLSIGGIQAASDGSAITYRVHGAPLGETPLSNNSVLLGTQVLSLRGAGGWRSEDINQPQSPPTEGGTAESLLLGEGKYSLFSPDLASAVVVPPIFTSFSSEGLAGTQYLRNNVDRSYAPLLTHANVWPGTTTLEAEEEVQKGVFVLKRQAFILAGTPDLAHLIVGTPLKLTGDAHPTEHENQQLYEWSDGRLQLVNILPNGEPSHDPFGVELAGANGFFGMAARAVSTDGRRVAWTRGEPYTIKSEQNVEGEKGPYRGLYVRDMVEGKTVQLGGLHAFYETMSSDGSHVFFLEKGDLYEYDATTGAQTDLTANHGPGEASAGVQESVSNVSEDGSYVYFVATGVLAEGAVSGKDNLYLLHDTAGKWSTSYVATLSSKDEPDWYRNSGFGNLDLSGVTSRVSPDGRYLAFMSERALTGYDNVDANPVAYEHEMKNGKVEVVMDKEGKPVRAHDEEVFLYDAVAGRLVCTSCDPSGARPHGVFDEGGKNPVVDGGGVAAWSFGQPHWLAGSLPAWQVHSGLDTAHQPRYLSNSGRLFFNATDALVPQDTNGVADVYQYEPPGVGDCTSTGATFGVRSGGCVGLISSGTSSAESAFFDASESGDNVFFIAAARLTAADADTGYDLWDAHVCSASAPCSTFPASPPACSSGDSCKSPPAPQPELFGPAPSATFSGSGNIAPPPTAASKPLTRAQKLAKALRACKKKKRKQRTACKRKAHKQYPAKPSRKATAVGGGK